MADKILFGIPEDNNPALTRKIAYGTGTEEARSMTFAGLITWLTSRLPFFNTANNLSEANATAVRSNLSVNSIAENTAALVLKADKTNVLEKNNTASFIPTLSYHPATVLYANNPRVNKVWEKGSTAAAIDLGTELLAALAAGRACDAITINPTGTAALTMPSDSQLVTIYGYSIGARITIIIEPAATGFVSLNDQVLDNNGGAYNVNLDAASVIQLIRVNSEVARKWMILNVSL
jgi:hypothetical protein